MILGIARNESVSNHGTCNKKWNVSTNVFVSISTTWEWFVVDIYMYRCVYCVSNFIPVFRLIKSLMIITYIEY